MRHAALVSILALIVNGCSFALVSGPPDNHRLLPSLDCTTSRVGPVLDTIFTALQTLNLVVAASSSDATWDDAFKGDPPFSRKTAIPVYATLAALGGAGMYYGFSRTGRCRSAKNELLIRGTSGVTPAPGTWPPAPQPGTWPPPATAPTPVPPTPPPTQTTVPPTTVPPTPPTVPARPPGQ